MQQQSWKLIVEAIKQAEATNSWKELGEKLTAAREEYAQTAAANSGLKFHDPKLSMLRRCYAHDYSLPGRYMITIVAADRKAKPFGEVVSHRTDLSDAECRPSAIGQAMLDSLSGITTYYPMVTVHKVQLMPDHMHLILFVTAPIVSTNGRATHLGNVIGGYKKGCNRAYWALTAAATKGVAGFPPVINTTPHTPIWALGYTDTIITGREHLAVEERYLDDNPRRLLIKRKHRDLFRTIYHVRIGGYEYAAIGNIFLLRKAWKERVQFHHWEHLCPPGFQPCTSSWHCSRFYKRQPDGSTLYYSAGEPQNTNTNALQPWSTNAQQRQNNGVAGFPPAISSPATPAGATPTASAATAATPTASTLRSEADAHTERLLRAADQGAVFTSPFISEREKAVRNALLTMGCPYIRLTKEGFTDLYTPSRSEFNACAEGNLLILAPWGERKRRTKITRAECKELNAQALFLCGHDLDMQIIQSDGFDPIIELRKDI